jgi:hypothetical protein
MSLNVHLSVRRKKFETRKFLQLENSFQICFCCFMMIAKVFGSFEIGGNELDVSFVGRTPKAQWKHLLGD